MAVRWLPQIPPCSEEFQRTPMMPLRPFEIHQPADLAQASDTLRELGDEASAYAGGTELLLAMKFDVLHYPHLVDIKKIPRLNSIEVTDDHLEIGATTTHYQLERSELVRSHLPVVAEMESRVANVRVRAAGTIGGNLSFAEPHSDPATLLNVLDSSVVLQSAREKREIPIGEFVIGAYETSLKDGELLTRIRIPLLQPHQRTAYTKFQVHERPTLGLALLLEIPDGGSEITSARVAVGCVSPFPQRSSEAEALLIGEQSTVEEQLDQAADVLADQAELVDDAEGGIDYKRSLIHTFLRRAYDQILARDK